jgi:hypothetical protein
MLWTRIALGAALITLLTSSGCASTWVAFEGSYARGPGRPAVTTSTFALQDPSARYTLRVFVAGQKRAPLTSVPSAVTLNDARVLGPKDFDRNAKEIDVPIAPRASNTLAVGVGGAPGAILGIQIIGVGGPRRPTASIDKTPPTIRATITPPPDAEGWTGAPATVTFTCSDAASGVASCPAPAVLATEGAGQVIKGVGGDVAGNVGELAVTVNVSTQFFQVRSYGGKCLDYGPPRPDSGLTVFLNDCATAQPVRVEEINASHEVILHAGASVIGFVPPIAGGSATTGSVLGLLPSGRHGETFRGQVFALDGDSIIVANSRPCIHMVNPDGTASPSSHLRGDVTACSEPSPPQPPAPPQMVVQIPGSGADGRGLIAAPRQLALTELWDFVAADGSGKDPTTGFVRVATAYDLWNAVCSSPAATPAIPPDYPPVVPLSASQVCTTAKAGWGSVIVITGEDPKECLYAPQIGPCLDFTFYPPIPLPAGVTIRGDRRATNPGPLLVGLYGLQGDSLYQKSPHIFDVQGDYVRVTGLRLQGVTRNTTDKYQGSDAIVVSDNHFYGTLIDHNDLSNWTNAAVEVFGPTLPPGAVTVGWPAALAPTGASVVTTCPPDPGLDDNARIERNFIHHNDEGNQGNGYGSVMSQGGTATILGNTYIKNTHSIASDPDVRNQYAAWFNLVLSNTPAYNCILGDCDIEHTFDMHGADANNHDVGGFAGNGVEIAWNTFLPSGSDNFDLRGLPCNLVDGVPDSLQDSFHNNVSMRNHDRAVKVWDAPLLPFAFLLGGEHYHSSTTSSIRIEDNQFADTGYVNPTGRLGVGDFDGDGRDDLFLATGAAWYFSSAGKAEWRYLNGGKTDRIDSLLLGDFDGDGRADVLGIDPNGQLAISWGGSSDWALFNGNALPCTAVGDMAVGDFDGDGRADAFCADGDTWWISYGGDGPFTQVIVASGLRAKDLRFGDFNADGTTDVFGVVNGTWSLRYAPKGVRGVLGGWQPLSFSLTRTVHGLVVADFAGIGRAEVGKACDLPYTATEWCVSDGTSSQWHAHGVSFIPLDNVMVAVGHFLGRFDVNRKPLPADILLWSGNDFSLSVGGSSRAVGYSTQEMR